MTKLLCRSGRFWFHPPVGLLLRNPVYHCTCNGESSRPGRYNLQPPYVITSSNGIIRPQTPLYEDRHIKTHHHPTNNSRSGRYDRPYVHSLSVPDFSLLSERCTPSDWTAVQNDRFLRPLMWATPNTEVINQ